MGHAKQHKRGQEGEGACQTAKTRPTGCVFAVRDEGDVLKHQNAPRRARPGVQDGGGEGRCPNTRTSPCGLVLVFETRERERGGAQAPECARMGTFWCLREGKGRGEAPEHQNVPVWARSGV